MTSSQIIVIGLIGILSIAVICVLWPRSWQIIGGLLRNMVLGLGLLWMAGAVFGEACRVGLNFFTAAICAVLGIPGCIMILLLKGFIL